MASFKNHHARNTTKMLVVGDSGAGKTSAIATLANAGFRTCIIDTDNGLDVLRAHLTEEGLGNLHYITLEDDSQDLKVGTSAWGKFMSLMTNGWKDSEEDLGKISTWGPDTVLVIDTLNFLCKAAMRDTLKTAGLPQDAQPRIQDYGEAARRVESKLAWLCSSAVKCNLVVNSHMRPIEDDLGRTRLYPATVGSSFSMSVPAYFNTYVRIDTRRRGNEEVKILRTRSDNKMDLKTSAPDLLEPEEPLDYANIIRKLQAIDSLKKAA